MSCKGNQRKPPSNVQCPDRRDIDHEEGRHMPIWSLAQNPNTDAEKRIYTVYIHIYADAQQSKSKKVSWKMNVNNHLLCQERGKIAPSPNRKPRYIQQSDSHCDCDMLIKNTWANIPLLTREKMKAEKIEITEAQHLISDLTKIIAKL